MNVNVLGARFRSWSLRLFLAMSLMAASGAVAEAGAASGNATTVEGSNGNAYVVVLPQTMSPAERDALLQSILAGKGTEAPVEEAESQGLLAAIDEDLRKVWEAVVAALENFDLAPQVPLHVLEVLAASRGGEATGLFVMTLFAVVFLGAAAVELCFRRFLWKPIPVPPEAAVARYTDRMKLALRWLLRDVIALAVFWGAAAVLFSAIYHLQDPGRQIVVSIVATVILVRFIIGVSNFILAPGAPSRRLAAFGDADASSSYAYFVVLVSAAALFLKPGTLVDRIGGVDPSARAAYGLIFGGIVLILSIILLRRLRRPVCEAVLAAGPKPEAPTAFRRWAAHSWHHFATAAFLAVYCITLFFRVFDADGNVTGSALGTMALILLTPFCMRSLRLLLNDYCTKRTEERHLAPTALRGSFEVALQRMIPVIVLVAALIVLGQLWGVSVFNLESLGIGARIYDAIVDIGIILIVAYFVWELVRGAIDQRLAEEHGSGVGADGSGGEDAEHAPASRISTLLPLFRTTLLIVMVLVVVFVVLSELGVNVGPLIAGAGVVGIAIGFGAQTLVTDVISGIFFLVDDAFRRGEYIDVGVAKGTVEKISLRSLQLRHHNGPVNTVPFGQIATVNNFSRDWAIIKLEIRVPFETDVNKVRKLVKKIGQEMMEDPAVKDMMLEPLKSQGVVRVDDSALIMRCKFTAKPGQQFLVRREAFTRIQKRFSEEGIHFAPRRVIVDAPTPEAAKAATAALDAEQLEGGGGDTR